MKNIKKIFPAIIICLLLLNIGATPVYTDDEVPRDIAIAFKVGNANELARYFNKTIELVILDKEDVYSNVQAEVIMDNFFKDHYPKSFEFIHQGSKSESQYAIGKLVTFNGTYRVMLLLKKKNDKPLISQLRIEEENE